MQASDHAFAAILGDGSVVTWGDAAYGGDSSEVQGQLRNVQQIQASRSAFAAILRIDLLSPGVMLNLVLTAALCRVS